MMMAAFRSFSSSLLPKAVKTASTALGSTPITVRSGHVHLGARGRFDFACSQIERTSTILGGVHRPVPGVSRRYGVAQPYPEGLEMEVGDGGDPQEEVVGGCRVRHGELWNEDVRIHYVECGDKDGELIILIHGFPNFWYVWKNQFQALAEAGYHVVAPDLRGYNTSSKPKSIQEYGRRSVVSDMVRLIDELGDGKPATVVDLTVRCSGDHLEIYSCGEVTLGTQEPDSLEVGHDWGGFVTWAVAEDFPDKVKKAVIANAPHLSVFSAALRSDFQQVRRSWYIGLFLLPWIPEWFMIRRGFKNLKTVLSSSSFQPLDIDRHVRAFQKVGTITGSINYYRAAVRGYWSPAAPSLVPVELPVELIWGELDPFLGKELAVISNTIASNVVIKLLPHCSHWPMWDDPKQFNALLIETDNSRNAISADEVHNDGSVLADEGLVA